MAMIGYETDRQREPSTPQDRYLARRRKRELNALPPPDRYCVNRIFSRESLVRCAKELIQHGGRAAGLDNVRPGDLTPSEIGRIAQAISDSILAGTYCPQKTRPHKIPKAGSDEMRTLQIAVFFDRVVARALNDAISPLVDTLFLGMSYGFRPGRSVWELLADLKVACEAEDTWVLAIADVRKAFDSVVIKDVFDAHRKLFQQHAEELGDYGPLLEVVEKVLRGHDPNRRVGIDQGSPYSPTALNIHLHVNHDVPITRDAIKPFWFRDDQEQARFADNLAYRGRSVTEGKLVLEHARQLLKAKQLDLKADGGVYDLNAGQRTPLLGFVLGKDRKEMTFELDNQALVRLHQHLIRTHDFPNPVQRARLALQGWIRSMGPAYQRSRGMLPEVVSLAVSLGFRESGSLVELEELGLASWNHWCARVTRAAKEYSRRHVGYGEG